MADAMVLQVSADLRRLEKAFEKASGKVDTEAKKMEARAQKMAAKIDSSTGNSGGGIQSLIDLLTGKLKSATEDASSSSGGLGEGLAELGPYGLAAAAGIGALTAALAGAHDAMKFADDLADTAARLHVTTDALQEYRYAIRAAGGDEEGADIALEAFSVTLGKAQQGLAKSQKAFLALGFTKAQIKGFTDAGVALDDVVKRISGLSAVQQDAIIQQLGLEKIKPLIQAGTDEMSRLRAEAHKVGVVMDAELVARGGALNDEFETVQKVIDVQLKSALVDLGPVLVGLVGLVANMAKFAADVANAFRSIPDKTSAGLEKDFKKQIAFIEAIEKQRAAGHSSIVGDANEKKAKERALQIFNEMKKRATTSNISTPIPTTTLIPSDTGGSKKTPKVKKPEERPEDLFAKMPQELQRMLIHEAQRQVNIMRGGGFAPAEKPALGAPSGMETRDISTKVGEAVTQVSALKNVLSDVGDIAEYSFAQGANAVDAFTESLKRMALEWAASKAADFLFGAHSADGGARSGGWLDGLFDGKRAMGGPVRAGGTYLVGERGPEIFRAPSNGSIVPNNMLGRMTSGNRGGGGQSLHFDLRGAVVTEDILRQMQSLSSQAVDKAVARSGSNMRRALPGMQKRLGKLGTA